MIEYPIWAVLKADQLFRLNDREGFLLNLTFSKTRRAGQFRPFTMLRIPNFPSLPGFWLNYCNPACGALVGPLLGEYLFRSSELKKFVTSSVWRVSRICTAPNVS